MSLALLFTRCHKEVAEGKNPVSENQAIFNSFFSSKLRFVRARRPYVSFRKLSTTGDASRDRDIETIWCGDFDRLRESLAKLDADVAIEKAMAIGATPVMVVEQAILDAERGPVQLPIDRTRSA